MRRVVASLTALSLALVSTGLAVPCVCAHAAGEETATHACCAAAQAEAAREGATAHQGCTPGCRHGLVEADEATAAERAPLSAPTPTVLATLAAPTATLRPALREASVAPPERAPPATLARHLATLQVWRC